MLTTSNVTSADGYDGPETHVRGEAYSHAVLDDEGCPALPLEEPPMSLREHARAIGAAIDRSLRTRPLIAMGLALGAGYLVGRLRAMQADRGRA